MSHYHTTSDGRRTSLEVVDPEDATNHWHTVDGEPTGNDEFGKGHSHLFAGIKTTGAIDDDGNGDLKKCIQLKFEPTEIEQKQSVDVNGIPVGIVKGYIATWDVDRGDMFGIKDKFVKGAFRESLADLKARGRNVRFKDHHGRTVGNFPFNTVFEDDRGLFGEGHLNLEVQQGKEAYSLALQKSLTEFSIGFTADESSMDGDVRLITKATIWEGSIVDEPMNIAAEITEVKEKITVEKLDKMTDRELEKTLKSSGFSKEAARRVVLKKNSEDQDEEIGKELLSILEKENKANKDKNILESIKQATEFLSA